MSIVKRYLPLLVCIPCHLASRLAIADSGDAATSPLFSDDATISVRIEAPLDTVMHRRDDADYHEGTLQYVAEDGAAHTLDVKLRARGRYRRRNDICRFAPLRLNFREKQVAGTLFGGQDKLKLVTHCNSSRSAYEQFLLKEYLSYRILQTLTDNSFAVRLLHVTWVDSEKPDQALERYAFLIEDDELLARRLDSTLAGIPAVDAGRLEPSQSSLVAVFQYLIGNTDYSLLRGPADAECCHNAVLIEQGAGQYLPIPYDFDFSGLVSAPYAKPNPKLPIRSVRSRLYRGHCELNDELPATLQRFRDRQSAIRELIATQQGLEPRKRDTALRFIDKFYDVIDSPRAVERKLVRDCV